jgi:hypothetical protein
MPKFIVHIRRHCGWHTVETEGATFGEAAVSAVVATCKEYGLDLDNIPHTVRFNESEGYTSVVFDHGTSRKVFRGMTYPGEFWFGEQVREGHADDCEKCGGTGAGFHNPFMQCYACGDRKLKGKGSGKKQAAFEAA